MRRFVVGDIHGGLRALKLVVKKVNPKNEDTFIFLGDYVDGWSENIETIDYLIEFADHYRCIFLRGNHDDLCHQYLKNKQWDPMWLKHGGASTKNSYDVLSFEDKKRHIAFFEQLKNYYIDEENRLYVHAGFTNLNGPQYEYYPNLVYWDRTLWEMACALSPDMKPESEHYPLRLKLFHEIYIGHTPVTRIGKTMPTRFANVWNIDTGAAFKGPLSIIDVQTKEVWQSDSVYELYPEESGRN